MRKRTVAAHVAIVGLACIVGWIGSAPYGFSCFYAKMPYGSECRTIETIKAFLPGFLLTSAALYAVWGAGFAVLSFMRRRPRY